MIRGYLHHRWPLFALALVVALAFPGIQWLYHIDLAPVWYACAIMLFLLVIFIAVDFSSYRKKIRMLNLICENLSMAEHSLPEASSPIEKEYHAIIRELYSKIAELGEAQGRQQIEQLDYYTMWVHQIKTPIAAMRLALQNGARPGVLEEELFKVERYVEMALQFVKMNDLSTDMVIAEYQLAPIVSGSVKKYASLFIGKRLKVDIEGVDFTVTTDAKWLSFIIEQLLSNAVKYTERGGVKITGGKEALAIEDTGIGIRQEDLKRIFHKGYTGYNGRVEQRASGLGLYMAKRVADQLSIRIIAESTLGKGTRMVLVFPAKDQYIQ